MGTTLDHGIYLPNKGERNCYEGLAGNWVALDNHLGSTNIHVTINDKQAWNGHVADTTIHVTSADKQAWNGKQDALSQTQLDAVNSGIDSSKVQQIATNTSDISSLQSGKADDNSVVHISGNESIIGTKRFGIAQNFTGYPSIRLYSTTDDITVLPSGVEQRDIRFTDKNNVPIAYFIFQHRNDASEPFRTCWRQPRLDGTSNYYSVNFNNLGEFYPENNNGIKLGTSTKRWKDCQTYLINGLEPSSLSLPSGNVSDFIDISSYFSNTGSGDTNSYTALANGWIYLRLGDISSCQVVLNDSSNRRLWGTNATGNVEQIIMPILKNTTLTTTWVTNSTVNIATARFIPCQGNV